MKQPISIYSSWHRSLPQMIVTAVITFLVISVFPKDEFIAALTSSLCIFLIYTFAIRFIVASAHRKGMGALAEKKFDVAIRQFERSFDFFSKHRWLDRYRSLIFMSPSVWSYREMALMNMAATYSMKKDTKMYRQANERLLCEYPNNTRAKNALEFLDAMRNEN